MELSRDSGTCFSRVLQPAEGMCCRRPGGSAQSLAGERRAENSEVAGSQYDGDGGNGYAVVLRKYYAGLQRKYWEHSASVLRTDVTAYLVRITKTTGLVA